MKIIYICSPLKGDIEQNTENALEYCRWITFEGNIPIAPHAYFTAFLDDEIFHERKFVMDIGLELLSHSDEIHVFGNIISEGMQNEIEYAKENEIPISYQEGVTQKTVLSSQAEYHLKGGW